MDIWTDNPNAWVGTLRCGAGTEWALGKGKGVLRWPFGSQRFSAGIDGLLGEGDAGSGRAPWRGRPALDTSSCFQLLSALPVLQLGDASV